MNDTVQAGALTGLRVLDLSRVLAGPWSAQLLADLGADVVKVERPKSGDDTRAWGPPWLHDDAGDQTTESAYFLSANRNKRSITIDMHRPEGQRLIKALACKADVVVENFKVGGLAHYGLDYDSLKALNPRLIYCSITGFGQTGPYAARAGYDFLIQGMGGLMSLTGRPDEVAGGGPMKAGVALTDVLTGLYATVAILAALARRERTGEGQQIDLALLDVQVATLANQAASFLVGGVTPTRMGNAHPSIVPYQDFPTSNGHMIIAVGNDSQFASLCTALRHSEWALDPRFATNPQRVAHRGVLIDLMCDITRLRATDDWTRIMEAAGVPCGPINDLEQVFANEQVRSRGMRFEMAHPLADAIPLVANPIKLSESPVHYRHAPPTLGQHTAEVLSNWLNMSDADVLALHRDGVV